MGRSGVIEDVVRTGFYTNPDQEKIDSARSARKLTSYTTEITQKRLRSQRKALEFIVSELHDKDIRSALVEKTKEAAKARREIVLTFKGNGKAPTLRSWLAHKLVILGLDSGTNPYVVVSEAGVIAHLRADEKTLTALCGAQIKGDYREGGRGLFQGDSLSCCESCRSLAKEGNAFLAATEKVGDSFPAGLPSEVLLEKLGDKLAPYLQSLPENPSAEDIISLRTTFLGDCMEEVISLGLQRLESMDSQSRFKTLFAGRSPHHSIGLGSLLRILGEAVSEAYGQPEGLIWPSPGEMTRELMNCVSNNGTPAQIITRLVSFGFPRAIVGIEDKFGAEVIFDLAREELKRS
jgi:hypothetical protein